MNASPLSILIIDDCPEDLEYLKRNLLQSSKERFDITEAESGIEGWKIFTENHFDCVIIDYQIPDLDGLEFLGSLREEPEYRFLPVLMLTGQGNEEIASEALKNGASDYLVKGKLTAEGLNRAVTRAIEKSILLRTNEKQRLEIERSQRDLEQFAYTAAHDLQAPVRRIIKFIELLQRDQTDLTERSRDYIGRALKSAEYMRTFIQDLLNYSLVGGAKNTFEAVDLNALLKEVLTQLELTITKTQATIHVDPLPTIEGNRNFLRELFQNLIGNALKFGSDRPLVIQIKTKRKKSEWVFTVQDNGIGIPPESSEKIFEIFQRIENGNLAEGTGIGLALCKKIVRLHEGNIWVESLQDSGTAFHFSIPHPEARRTVSEPSPTQSKEASALVQL